MSARKPATVRGVSYNLDMEESNKARVVIHGARSEPALDSTLSHNEQKSGLITPLKAYKQEDLKIDKSDSVETKSQNSEFSNKSSQLTSELIEAKVSNQAATYTELKKQNKIKQNDHDLDKIYRAQLIKPLTPLIPLSPRYSKTDTVKIEDLLHDASITDNIFKKMSIYNQLITIDITPENSTQLLPHVIQTLSCIVANLEPYQNAIIDVITESLDKPNELNGENEELINFLKTFKEKKHNATTDSFASLTKIEKSRSTEFPVSSNRPGRSRSVFESTAVRIRRMNGNLTEEENIIITTELLENSDMREEERIMKAINHW